jgi:hypothetical protein
MSSVLAGSLAALRKGVQAYVALAVALCFMASANPPSVHARMMGHFDHRARSDVICR